MRNTCAIPGCETIISKMALMCAPHWRLLPVDFRSYVWNAYRKRAHDEQHRQAHLKACSAAVEVVLSTLKEKESACSNQAKATET